MFILFIKYDTSAQVAHMYCTRIIQLTTRPQKLHQLVGGLIPIEHWQLIGKSLDQSFNSNQQNCASF